MVLCVIVLYVSVSQRQISTSGQKWFKVLKQFHLLGGAVMQFETSMCFEN